MKIIDFIAVQAAEMATPRRDLHGSPELYCKEVRTANVVAQKLTEWGIPFTAVNMTCEFEFSRPDLLISRL